MEKQHVNVTESVKAMLSKCTPKVHGYRVDSIETVNIVVEIHGDHYTEALEVILRPGADIDENGKEASKYIKNKSKCECVTFEGSGTSTLRLVLNDIIVSDEVKAKYARSKKKVTVDDLLNDENISSKLKELLIKETNL
jgi:hypothetical protein